MRKHLQQVAKTTGKIPNALLEQPKQPKELRYAWDWYLDMRTDVMLTFSEIESWSQLTKRKLLAWEIDLIRALDRLYWSGIQ